MSARLLIAVADDETARRAAAQAREAEMDVVDIVAELDEIHRALRRLDVDVVLLHDALGGTPVLDLARDLAVRLPRSRADPARRRGLAGPAARRHAGRPARRRRAPARARVLRGQRPLRRAVVAHDARPGRGRGVAPGALGGQLVAVAGSKGGVGTTTIALHLGLAAARLAPGRPVCLVDFDLQKGDFRALLDTPHRRSVVDLVTVSNEISVRHLQETLYTHKEGFRLLLAPEEGEKAEDVDGAVARNVLSAVKARHALTVVDIGAVATEATAIAAEMASQVIVVTTPDVLALRGVRRMRELWKRLGVREDEDVQDRAQPGLAAARDPARPGAQGRRRHDGPDHDPGRLQRARGRGQHRLAEPDGGQQAARRVRVAGRRARRRPAPRRSRARATTSRAVCWPAWAASAARRTAEFMGLLPDHPRSSSSASGRWR